ncbi:MAG: HNH endonuclease signature motif containing protein, partial [Sciscionella sp.]
RMACDAGVIAAVLGRDGEILDMSSRARTAPASLRRRLALRDGGCAFPGCPRTPAQSDAHHIREWAHGGFTNPDNMVLLCGYHHRMVHHTGWEIHMHNSTPYFLPPVHRDPHRRPLRQPTLRQPSGTPHCTRSLHTDPISAPVG